LLGFQQFPQGPGNGLVIAGHDEEGGQEVPEVGAVAAVPLGCEVDLGAVGEPHSLAVAKAVLCSLDRRDGEGERVRVVSGPRLKIRHDPVVRILELLFVFLPERSDQFRTLCGRRALRRTGGHGRLVSLPFGPPLGVCALPFFPRGFHVIGVLLEARLHEIVERLLVDLLLVDDQALEGFGYPRHLGQEAGFPG
jgi:hypothetical protein